MFPTQIVLKWIDDKFLMEALEDIVLVSKGIPLFCAAQRKFAIIAVVLNNGEEPFRQTSR